MTLVGTTTIRSHGIVFADVLITAPGAELPHAFQSLPAVRDLSAVLPSEYHFPVTGLRQKLNRVGDRFAVAWAGSVVAASAVLRDLKDAFPAEPPQSDVLLRLLATHGGGLHCELVGRVLVADKPYSFHWSSSSPEHLDVGDSFLAGMGAKSTAELARGGRIVSANYSPMMAAVGFVGQLVGAEARTGGTLLEGFGGAYQILVEDHGSFVEPDSITFVLAIADLSAKADGPITVARNFLKYGHVEGFPYCARIGSSSGNKEVHLFRLHPTLECDETRVQAERAFSKLTAADVSVASSFYCICLDAALPGKPDQRGRMVHVVDASSSEVNVQRAGTLERVSIEGSVFSGMRETLLREVSG